MSGACSPSARPHAGDPVQVRDLCRLDHAPGHVLRLLRRLLFVPPQPHDRLFALSSSRVSL